MGTRSNICRENDDGSYDVIYCHWDGYPSNNGRILHDHYNTPEKVDALIALGDLSSLNENIGEKHDFDDYHTTKAKKWCTFYGRDRGEERTAAQHYENADKLEEAMKTAWSEWVYMFRVSEGKWYFTNNASPTWFKCCGEQRGTELLTPAAWKKEEV